MELYTPILLTVTGCLLLLAAPRVWQRLLLSRAKHRSLAGHARMARRVARWVRGYALDEDEFYRVDGADASVTKRRQAGLQALSERFSRRFAVGAALNREAASHLPDLQFTSRYRVPFPFADHLSQLVKTGSFFTASTGVRLRDVDGNELLDVSGSYGVNLMGYDFYKSCIREAQELVGSLGPVLGSYHPCVLDNARRLRELSGLEQVTFHMSGTEAVMQAVRLARYHTGRTHLVRFCGAYHGWWEDVQPGPGNPAPHRETYTLRDMDERSLSVIRQRRDIACVLVNPLQALHPNASAPGDSSLIDGSRRACFDRQAYTHWLQRLRQACTDAGVALIFDEVFLGFRLAPGGAQAYFGVQADMVTYGKTLGGGLPIGVVCGKASWMQRFTPDRPADICFARGTFNAHPYVMASMNVFLQRLQSPSVQSLYQGLDERWESRAQGLNRRLADEGLPVRVAAMGTVWTVLYEQRSRYHWMLQFYLRDAGLALSWVGSGRLIFSLNWDDTWFSVFEERFIGGCRQMQRDGWWDGPELSKRDVVMQIAREMFRRRRHAQAARELAW